MIYFIQHINTERSPLWVLILVFYFPHQSVYVSNNPRATWAQLPGTRRNEAANWIIDTQRYTFPKHLPPGCAHMEMNSISYNLQWCHSAQDYLQAWKTPPCSIFDTAAPVSHIREHRDIDLTAQEKVIPRITDVFQDKMLYILLSF